MLAHALAVYLSLSALHDDHTMIPKPGCESRIVRSADCPGLLQALTVFTWAQKVALGGSVLLTALSGSAAFTDDSHRPLAFGLLAGAVASGLAAAQLSKVCQRFIFVDYVQQDH